MATCFYPSLAAEDFIPLPETTPSDSISRPSRRRHRKYRIVPEFCAAKSSTRDFNAAAAAVSSVPGAGNHRRKRCRDAIGDDHSIGDLFSVDHIPHKMSKASPSLGHEDEFGIQGHESEIDHSISQHDLVRKIKEKDEEIVKMGKLNRLLQEQVNSLSSENRIWRGLAEDNEAEADSSVPPSSTSSPAAAAAAAGSTTRSPPAAGAATIPGGRERTAEMRRRNRGACTCICRGVRAPASVLVVVATVGRGLGWKCKKERK